MAGAPDWHLKKCAIWWKYWRKIATLGFGHVVRDVAPRVAPRSPTSGGGAPRKRRRFACENFAHWWRDAAASKMEELHWERQGAPSCAQSLWAHCELHYTLSLYIYSLARTHTQNSCAPCGPSVNAKTPPRAIDLPPSRYMTWARAQVRHFGVAKIYRGRALVFDRNILIWCNHNLFNAVLLLLF